jgi:GDP-L-fucose synthase
VNLLILGASGFIGRNCLNYFSTLNNLNVTGVTHSRSLTINPGCRIVTGDLLSKQFVDSIITPDVDVILQFAATTSGARDIVERPHIHTADNAIMNSLVFRRAHEVGVQKLVFPSCSVMYQSSSTPLKESDYDPSSPLVKAYFGVGSTKLYLEKMCEFYGSLGRTRFIALRHSNLYGPYDKYDLDRSHFTGATLRKVLDAEEGGTIRVWGDGSTRRDLLYVDDFVRAIELTLDKVNDSFNLFNVGSGVDYSVSEVIQRIVRISGKSIKLEYDTSMPTIKTGLSLDCSRFTQATGWSPSTSLEEGLNLSYEWLSAAIS